MLSAAPQDPVGAGYTQLICGSSDEDNDEDTPSGADDKRIDSRELQVSETAADRLLHMLEADYHRCLEAERSTPAAPSPADADREASTGVDACEHKAEAGSVVHIAGGGGGESRTPPEEGTGIAGDGGCEAGDDAAGKLCADVSAASRDTDIAAATAPADPTGSVAGGGIQSGAFAQAVASSSADDIQAAMAGISLPSTAWPAWAQDVSEKELLDRMRANLK